MSKPTNDPTLTRLTLGYFSVVMVFSLAFSTLFYIVSTAGLDIQVTPGSLGSSSLSTGTITGDPLNDPPPPAGAKQAAPADTEQLAREVDRFMSTIRRELLLRLVFFNACMVPLGFFASQWLASRTLRPIHRAIEAQIRFASDASHELRTPLAIMQAELEVALAQPRLTLARARQALTGNLEETQRLQSLADSLLLLARDEVLPRKVQVMAPLVDKAIASVAPAAGKKHITIVQHMVAGTAYVHGASFVQALSMLLDNAIKYSGAHSTITVLCKQTDGRMQLSISDQGKGIAAQDLPHIRKRFYQADTTQPGHGLGLSIVDKIIHQHDGQLTIDSQLGKGSTFTIILPIKD